VRLTSEPRALARQEGPIDREAPWLTRAAERVAVYGPAAVILTLPLEFTVMFLHQQLSRIVLLGVGAAFAYLVVTRRRALTVPRAPSLLLLVLFVAASLVSWALTRQPGSASSVVDIALYPFVALLISNLVLSRDDHRRAWVAFAVSGLVVAILGVGLYVFHGHIWTPNPLVAHRLNITFADPNITARFLTLAACAAIFLYAQRQSPAWLAFATAVACGVVLPLTFSRSGLALFIASALFAVAVAFNHRRAAAIGAVALLAFAVSTGVNPDTRQRATDAVETLAGIAAPAQGSSSGEKAGQGASALDDNRRYLIAAGLTMFKDHPVLGVGFGGYQREILTTYQRFLPSGHTDSVSHTSFVTVLAEQGLIGTLLFVAFLFQLARESLSARRRRDVWSTLPALMVIPIFLYSQFEGRFFQEPYLWLSLGLLYSAHVMAQGGRQEDVAAQRRAA
jgi:putative inorganic carbon (hco3(-)) transporter